MILHQINKIPSQHELLPNLGVLDRLLIEKTDSSKISAIQRETEQLPYYLRGTFSALLQMESERVEAVSALDGPGVEKNTRIILSPDKSDPLSFAFDFYLFCMRRACDALISYVGRCPNNLSLPSSIYKLTIGLKNSTWPIDSVIRDTLLIFWDSIGERLKDYRDQVNHKAIIISNCVAFNVDTEKRALKALLPDNPKEKRPSEIRYEPGVPLMGFAIDGFAQLTHMVNVIVERMIDLLAPDTPDVRSTAVVSIAMRGAPFRMGSKIRGELVPYPTNMKNVISSAVGRKYGFPRIRA